MKCSLGIANFLEEIASLSVIFLFPGGSDSEASAYSAGDLGSIPGLGRSPRDGNDNPLEYSRPPPPPQKGGPKKLFIRMT